MSEKPIPSGVPGHWHDTPEGEWVPRPRMDERGQWPTRMETDDEGYTRLVRGPERPWYLVRDGEGRVTGISPDMDQVRDGRHLMKRVESTPESTKIVERG